MTSDTLLLEALGVSGELPAELSSSTGILVDHREEEEFYEIHTNKS